MPISRKASPVLLRADIAGLPDLAKQSNVPIESDRANLDRIKTLIIGLRGTGQCHTELTQGWIIRKLSTPRIEEAFLRLSLSHPRLNFDLRTYQITKRIGEMWLPPGPTLSVSSVRLGNDKMNLLHRTMGEAERSLSSVSIFINKYIN